MAASKTDKPADEKKHSTNETIKETLESIVIAFILAFVFRQYVVEAFQIPTGSMAPTLLGAHARVTCAQCGYRFEADWPANAPGMDGEGEVPVQMRSDRRATCPMCRFANTIPAGSVPHPGDRILVHKYIYNVSEPRRWDVVVFKAPPTPDINFIKRLVGLPNEELQIIEGNVYARQQDARGTPTNDWHIERKSVRPDVQRAVWQPVYHSQFIPLDDGKPGSTPRSQRDPEHAWKVPWKAQNGAEQWTLDGTRAYEFKPGPAGGGTGGNEGVIAFDFAQQRYGQARGNQRGAELTLFPYDQFRWDTESKPPDDLPVEDVRVAASVRPQGPGLAVSLQTTARWEKMDGGQRVTIAGRIASDGSATLTAAGQDGKEILLQRKSVGPFVPGKAREVELWYVDQEASLWIDGAEVLQAAFALDFEYLVSRAPLPPRSTPDIRITVKGAPVSLGSVEVDRDICYSPERYPRGDSSGKPGLGVLIKHLENGQVRVEGQPAILHADQFFCMGDNSPLSADSRLWFSVDPWVQKLMLGNQEQVGIVPRELMMGRAFFVYWPAMYNVSPQGPSFVPNFGDMRFIH